MKRNKKIKVCDTCGTPLIWTFHWAYKEYFCINCDAHWGMLGAGEDVNATPGLKEQTKRLYKLWRVLGKYALPVSSFARTGCKKCQGCNHWEHLSKKEKREDKIARKILEALQGCFLNYEKRGEK